MGNMAGIYKNILEKRGIWHKVKEEELFLKWPEIAGREIANNSKAVKINNGILWIKVKDSIWLHHLSMMKREIKDKVNKRLHKKIKDIYFFIGEIEEEEEKIDEVKEKAWEFPEEDFEDGEIEEILIMIENEELHGKIKKILRNYKE